MELNTLFSVIEKYGADGVVVCIIIFAVWYFIETSTKKTTANIATGMDKIATNLSEIMAQSNKSLQTGLLQQNELLVTHIIKKQTETHDKHLEHRLDVDKYIDDKLRDMLLAYRADRVAVFEFHNSKSNFDGLPFAWTDIHYEKFSKGTDDIMMKVQNQPSSVLSYVADELKENDYLIWDRNFIDNELFEHANVLYNLLRQIPELQTLMYLPIYNDDNRLVGLVSIEWHYEIDIDEEITENIEIIRENVANIKTYISLKSETEEVE